MDDQVRAALESGKAFADLSAWRKVAVDGRDCVRWLAAMTSDDLSGLAPGRAVRTTLRIPGAGDVSVTIAVSGGSVVVVQAPDADPSVAALLDAQKDGADVVTGDRTTALCLFSFPGRETPPGAPGSAGVAPSAIGHGSDLFGLGEDHAFLLERLSKRFTMIDEATARAWAEQLAASDDRG